MDIITLIILVATVIPAIYGGIQLIEWLQKRKRQRKRKKTLMLSQDSVKKGRSTLRIINFTHPLTPEIIKQIQQVLHEPIEEIIEIKTQLDEDLPLDEQIDDQVDKVKFTSEEWQSGRFLVHLPGLAPTKRRIRNLKSVFLVRYSNQKEELNIEYRLTNYEFRSSSGQSVHKVRN